MSIRDQIGCFVVAAVAAVVGAGCGTDREQSIGVSQSARSVVDELLAHHDPVGSRLPRAFKTVPKEVRPMPSLTRQVRVSSEMRSRIWIASVRIQRSAESVLCLYTQAPPQSEVIAECFDGRSIEAGNAFSYGLVSGRVEVVGFQPKSHRAWLISGEARTSIRISHGVYTARIAPDPATRLGVTTPRGEIEFPISIPQ